MADDLGYGDLGCYFGLPWHWDKYNAMQAEAIKGIHARAQHFEIEGPNYSGFPSQELKDYEADEISQGRDPIWTIKLSSR